MNALLPRPLLTPHNAHDYDYTIYTSKPFQRAFEKKNPILTHTHAGTTDRWLRNAAKWWFTRAGKTARSTASFAERSGTHLAAPVQQKRVGKEKCRAMVKIRRGENNIKRKLLTIKSEHRAAQREVWRGTVQYNNSLDSNAFRHPRGQWKMICRVCECGCVLM